MKKLLFISFLCLVFTMFTNTVNAQKPGDVDTQNDKCCFWLEQIDPAQIVTSATKYHLNPIIWDKTDPQYNIGKVEYYYFRFHNCLDPKTKLSIDWNFLVDSEDFDRPLDATPTFPRNLMNVEIEWQLPLINPVGPGLQGWQGTGPFLSGMGLNSNITPPYINIDGRNRAIQTDFPGQIDHYPPYGSLFGYFNPYGNQSSWYNYIYADFLEWACENNYLRVKITRYSFNEVKAHFKLMKRIGGFDFEEWFEVNEDFGQHDYMGGHGAIVDKLIGDFWLEELIYTEGEGVTVCSGVPVPDLNGGPDYVFWPQIPDEPHVEILPDQPYYNPIYSELCEIYYVDSIVNIVHIWKPMPQAPIKDSVGICAPGAAILTASDPYEDDYELTFKWYLTENATRPIHIGKTFPVVGLFPNTTYHLWVTATFDGCEGPATRYDVTVNSPLRLKMNDTDVCPNLEEYCPELTIRNGYGDYDFEWSENDEIYAIDENGCFELFGECGETHTITVNVHDNYSNCEATTTATFTIREESPTFDIDDIDGVTVYTDADCFADIDPDITGWPYDVNIKCDYNVNPTWEDSDPIAGQCNGNYIIERTWTIATFCGDSTQKIQTINVIDRTAPVSTFEVINIQAILGPECVSIIPEGTVDALVAEYEITDNCSAPEEILARILQQVEIDNAIEYIMLEDSAVVDCGVEDLYFIEVEDDCGNKNLIPAYFNCPDPVTITIIPDMLTQCNTDENIFELETVVENGLADYIYEWGWIAESCTACDGSGIQLPDDESTLIVNPIMDSADRFVAHYPKYWVEVTDANGCKATDTTELTLLPLPDFSYEATDHYYCNSNTKGVIDLYPDDGTYQYYLGDLEHPVIGATIYDLVGGDYIVIAENEEGCFFEKTIFIDSVYVDINPELYLGATLPTLRHEDLYICWSDITTINVNMLFDRITGFAYEYNIFVPDDVMTVVNPGPIAIDVNAAGYYWVYGSVTNLTTGCVSDRDSLMVFAVQTPEFDINLDNTAMCAGDSTIARVVMEKPTLPLTANHTIAYLWSTGSTGDTAVIHAADKNFWVTVTYTFTNPETEVEQSCEFTKNGSVTINPSPTFTYTTTPETCFGDADGKITITASGQPDFLYSFDGGTTWVTTNYIYVSSGTYIIGVKDDTGCTAEWERAFVDGPEGPLTAEAYISAEDSVPCFGMNAIVTVVASGGTSPYQYFHRGDEFDGPQGIALPAGLHHFTIIDAHGCDTIINILITEPDSLIATPTVEDICAGAPQTVTVTITGGTAPYFYDGDEIIGNSFDVEDLDADDYTFPIVDARGCEATAEITIYDSLKIEAVILPNDSIDCAGGTATVTIVVEGGKPPYRYFDEDGEEFFDATIVLPARITPYEFKVTDANDCEAFTDITITEPHVLLAQAVILPNDSIQCYRGTGYVTINVVGGTPPYRYFDNNGTEVSNYVEVTAGEYVFTIVDAHGCDTTARITVTQPIQLVAYIDIVDTIYCHGDPGKLVAYAYGGTRPYTYLWNTGAITDTLYNCPGDALYTVTVTDAHGCTQQQNIYLIDPPNLVIDSLSGDRRICADGDGELTAYVRGGTGSYTYLWTDGQTTRTATNLGEGTHVVIVTDENGCQAQDYAILTKYPEVILSIEATKDCHNDTIYVTVTSSEPAVLTIQGYNAIPDGDDDPVINSLSCSSGTPVTTLTCKFTYINTCSEVNWMYFVATASDIVDNPCEYEAAQTDLINFSNAPEFYVYATAGGPFKDNEITVAGAISGTSAPVVNHYFRVLYSNECNDEDIHLSVDYKYFYKPLDLSSDFTPIPDQQITNYLHHPTAGITYMNFITPMYPCLGSGSSFTYNNISEDSYFPYQASSGWVYQTTAYSFFRLDFFENREITVALPGFDSVGIYQIVYELVTHVRIPDCGTFGTLVGNYCQGSSGIGRIGGTNFYLSYPGNEYKRIVLGRKTMTITVTPPPPSPAPSTMKTPNVRVFPNPANDNITLSFENMKGDAKVQIFNISGQLVLDKPINITGSDINIILPDLKPGFYFIHVKSNDAILTNKLVIEPR